MLQLRTVLTFFPILGLAASLAGQMAGTYTIDPSGTGPRNFKDFNSAIYALWSNGMGSSVVLEVAPGSYTEFIQIVPITGMSRSRTLTLRSRVKHAAILNAQSADSAIYLRFSSASVPIAGLVIDGFVFANGQRGIRSMSDVHFLEVRNCLFRRSLTDFGLGSTSAPVAVAWDIHHNEFEGSSSWSYRPLVLYSLDGSLIHHNKIVIDGHFGLTIGTLTPSTNRPTRIYNNIITGKLRANSNDQAVHLSNAAYDIEFMNNTMVISGSATHAACLRVTGGFTRAIKLRGNILVQTGTGPVLTIAKPSPYYYELDHNLYHTTSGTLVTIQNTTTKYATLNAWQSASGKDTNSLFSSPQFENGPTHPLRPKRSSSALGLAMSMPGYVTDDFEGVSRANRPDAGAYEIDPPTRVYGRGCAGSGGYVPVFLTGLTVPKIGGGLILLLDKALGGPGVRVWLIVGSSSTRWGSVPLPLRFGGGCDLWASADLIVPVQMGGANGPGQGKAAFGQNIPNDPKLLGSRTFFQWGVADPAAKGLGIAFSNALEVDL